MFQQVESVADALSMYLGISEATLDKLVLSLVLVLLLVLLRRATGMVVERRLDDPARRYIAVKTVDYLLGLVSVLVLLRIWLGGFGGLAASIGIISAGLAIALHAPLTNLAGWIFLAVRRPFVVGDRIQIGDHAGDVIDLRLFAFSLVEIGNWVDADQSTGRILHIPNGHVFQQAVANYTQGFNFIWDEMPIVVTFESDWRKAKQILTEIIQRHNAIRSEHAQQEVRRAASKFMIKYEHLTPIVWTSVADIGVTLTIRYMTDPRRRRSTENAIWEDILDSFWAADDIDFAYPTVRYYDNVGEGKPGRRPEAQQPR
ncbi:MAG: mechanosensitive ion channel family protein [Thermoanaerobaculales bacterium]|jgi:small-conductance mechanosensitive channel|nr:mechanosensitive ion channel family protein [Thermoanaerobaculales bacterium]